TSPASVWISCYTGACQTPINCPDCSLIYDPAADTWVTGPSAPTTALGPTGGWWNYALIAVASTRLQDGSPILFGGYESASAGLDSPPGCGSGPILYVQYATHANSRIFDPVALTWSAGPSLQSARANGTATLLADGRLVVA